MFGFGVEGLKERSGGCGDVGGGFDWVEGGGTWTS